MKNDHFYHPVLLPLLFSVQYFINVSKEKVNPSTILFKLNSMSKYEQLPNGIYELKKQYVQDVAQMLAKSFSKNNPIWAKASLQIKVLQAFFLQQLNRHLKMQEMTTQMLGRKVILNTIIVEDGFLTGSVLNYDIEHYRPSLHDQKTSSEIPLFVLLEELGKQLMEGVDISSFQPGKCFYTSFGNHSTNNRPSLVPPHYGIAQNQEFYKLQGYRYSIGRASSERLLKLSLDVGATKLNQIELKVGGTTFKLYLILLDMENPTFLKVLDAVKALRRSMNGQSKL